MIEPDSSQSPIRKYFTTQKIIWSLDDFHISYSSSYLDAFKTVANEITKYDGNVNINIVFADSSLKPGSEIRNYSVVQDLGWSESRIDSCLNFFEQKGVYPQSHGWNHTEELDNANLSLARKIVDYSLWNLKNNFGITAHFFLGHNYDGNYNITLAMKEFSDEYWTVYGEHFDYVGAESAIEFITESPRVTYPIDPLFGNHWGTPCKTLEEGKDKYHTKTVGKEIIFIRGHPGDIRGDERNLTLWTEWIDWIYQTHTLININHTEAIEYNIDRYNFAVEQNSPDSYTIDLTNCEFGHNVLFTNPDGTSQQNWILSDQNGNYIGIVREDVFLQLKSGVKYFLSTDANQPLTADFSWSPVNPSTGEQIIFTDTSVPGSKSITTWVWVFDDGNTSTLQNPTHHYATVGTYHVTLTVTGNDSASDSISKDVVVVASNVPPTAEARGPYSGYTSQTITFDASGSTDSDGTIVGYRWDWTNDGTYDTSWLTTPTTTHSYPTAGSYTIKLKVQDNAGATSRDTATVTVTIPQNQPPTADFTYTPSSPTNVNIIQFTDTSTDIDGTIASWSWTFGDGSTSTSQHPTHKYAAAGTYQVTLTVKDNDALTDSQLKEIKVVAIPDTEPPSNVTGLRVTDAKNGRLNLVWNAAADNIAVGHYKIYRNNVFLLNRTSTSYQDTGLTNGQSYSYQVSAVDISGIEGDLSDSVSGTPTKSSGGGGGGGGCESQNQKPVADLSAGEPYQGLVNTAITFDGSKSSDSDGNITKWFWVFGDNTNGTGKTISHSYPKAGTYPVTLTVTDNKEATNTDITTCVITQPNRSPTDPIITGLKNGTKNTLYTYTAFSTDADNDMIQYTFDWGDHLSLSQSRGFLPNGTILAINHSWTTAGRYDITVTANDNQTTSSSKITVYIDAKQTGDIGYLLDNNGDGIYDAFYSDASKQIITVQNQDGSYTIDSDGNGEWDYTFDAIKGLASYQESPKEFSYELIIIIGATAFIFLWKLKSEKKIKDTKNDFTDKDKSKKKNKKQEQRTTQGTTQRTTQGTKKKTKRTQMKT